MNIHYRDGLIFTSITLTFRGVQKEVDNIVIDTGASETIISPDIVEDIGIEAELDDIVNSFYGICGSLHNFFSKQVQKVKFGELELDDIKVVFGVIDPKGQINGLLGLDLLIRYGITINLKEFTVSSN